jgi:ferredoxin-NADP reductase
MLLLWAEAVYDRLNIALERWGVGDAQLHYEFFGPKEELNSDAEN